MRLKRNLFILLAWILPAVSAAILAIDYGADFTKLSLVKPGVPFDILLDRDSKRKIPSVVGWKRDERVVGTEGKQAATRFPHTHYPYAKALLGATELPDLDIFPNPPVLSEDGSLVFSHDKLPKHITPTPGNEKETWTPTAVLAHQLAYYKALADEAAGEPVTQAVVTVPAWWNQAQRKAYRDALELQGIHCMAMIGEGTAIGLNYAMTRTFPDYNPETGEGEKAYHLVYDSGALSTSATVLGFYQTSWKPTPNSKMVINTTHVEALGVGWEDVGGLSLDLALRELILDDVILKLGNKDVANDKKAMAKIDKEAIRVKQILSANQESMTSIESVFDDLDYRSKVSRAALERKFHGKMAAFMKPIEQALNAADLELKNISSVILFGGNTRVPFVRAELHKVLGSDELIAQNVNADESAVLGAAFHGASQSRKFKMKSVEVHERSIYDVKMDDKVLFPAGTPFGQRKSVLLKPEDEINVEFSQNGNPISLLVIPDIKDALANFTASEPAINVTVRLDNRGILSVANVALVSEAKEEPASGGVAGALKGMFGGKKDESSQEAEVEVEADAEQLEAESNDTDSKPVKKVTKPRVALKFRERPIGPTHLTKEQKSQTNQRLRAIASYEGAMRAREEARNMLEGYLYKLQNLLSDDEAEHKTLHIFSTKEERTGIKDLVGKTLEWLHEHADDATVHTLIKKREAIEALEQPIVTRFDEFEKRPAAVVNIRTALYAGRAFVDEARENNTRAAEEAKTAPADQPVAPPRYTEAEIQEVEDLVMEGGKWLDEHMEKQMPLNEDKSADPVVFSKDIDNWGRKIQGAVLRLTSRKPPRVPKVKSTKAAEEKNKEEEEAKERTSFDPAPPPSAHDVSETSSSFHFVQLTAPLPKLTDFNTLPFLGRATMAPFTNPFRRAAAENKSGQITVHVKWGRERFNIPIPNPDMTPLGQLVGTLSHQTGIPPDQIKLVYKGAVLKDSSLTISSYGIADGSTITMVGKEGPAPAPLPPPQQVVKKKNKQPDTDSEPVLVDWIRNLVAGVVDPLEASIVTFVHQAAPSSTNKPKVQQTFEVLQREHARLSELLLKGLLDMDGIEIPGGWTEARAERKNGVKRLQGELTRVDDAWGNRKRLAT
ncbi:hypothetical protein CspeluHIS016_0703960 [Cutaneotrichosporon spelunceum]|uniref:Actin-like ATPase domain-containing protein n=1 Tax=Cutaneotrichosporon spelunceum TaxID=1672016 RepID=A0AAD3TYT8_9TREE|nr:hypothetical protein CspeluHIS016_0703960 [Cutaneotrichosporon spelunceum]